MWHGASLSLVTFRQGLAVSDERGDFEFTALPWSGARVNGNENGGRTVMEGMTRGFVLIEMHSVWTI
jgi:hypothetical protein